MIFDDTKELLQKTEEAILNLKNNIDKVPLEKAILFISKGKCHSFKNIFYIALILYSILLVLAFFSSPSLSIAQKLIANGLITIVLSMIFAPFTIPSIMLTNEIKRSNVKKIKDEILKKKLSSIKLQAIKENLAISEAAFKSKLLISNWIIASLWAVYVYCFTKCFIDNALINEPIKLYTLGVLCTYAIFLGLIFMVKMRFQKTGKRIFMTLKFALNESIAEGEINKRKR